MTRDEKSKELEASRQADYGDPTTCHINIGAAWSAYLLNRRAQHGPISEADVACMFALAKIIRVAYSPKQDSFDDAHVYLDFAERFSKPITEYRDTGVIKTLSPLDIPDKPRKERVTSKECLRNTSCCPAHEGYDGRKCDLLVGHLGRHYDVISGSHWHDPE